MSSYQERQLLCGHRSVRQNSPIRADREGRAVQEHRPLAVVQLLSFVDEAGVGDVLDGNR